MKKTPGQRLTMQQVYGYLAGRGIPRQMIEGIRTALIYDGVTEAKDVMYDRIYSAVALMIWRRYKLSPSEIVEALKEFDRICGAVLDSDESEEAGAEWTDIMKELREETGIVIHTGDDNRLICESTFEEEEETESGGRE